MKPSPRIAWVGRECVACGCCEKACPKGAIGVALGVIARVKAVLRRSSGRGEGALVLGGIRLDREKHTVEVNGQEVVLTFREFELLRFLMEHPEKAFDRDRLLDEVWGAEYDGGPRTVDMHVQTIRKKLGKCASQIETIYGLGYKIGEGNHAQ